ncbi:MAG: hypothetical protein II649_04255 [Kiritimatiellae bacterium]|nr:hypothetical protein [Kiritimatiellia bacterium]
MKLIHKIFDRFFESPLHPCGINRPTDSMLECEESAQMKTAAGMFFLSLYYLSCKCFIRFPKSIPIKLKGIAV